MCFVEVLAAGSGIPEIKCFLLLGSEGRPRRADGNSTRWNFHEFERPPNAIQTPSIFTRYMKHHETSWNIMKHEQYSYRRLYWHCLNDCAKIASATLHAVDSLRDCIENERRSQKFLHRFVCGNIFLDHSKYGLVGLYTLFRTLNNICCSPCSENNLGQRASTTLEWFECFSRNTCTTIFLWKNASSCRALFRNTLLSSGSLQYSNPAEHAVHDTIYACVMIHTLFEQRQHFEGTVL